MSISSDFFEEELDYEVDEDILLESDEESLVKKMSATSVTPPDESHISAKQIPKSEDDDLIAISQALPDVVITAAYPANFRCPNDVWNKSISTLTVGAIESKDLEDVVKCEVKEELKEKEKVMESEQLKTQIAESMQGIPECEFKAVLVKPGKKNHDLVELNHSINRNKYMIDLSPKSHCPTKSNRISTIHDPASNGIVNHQMKSTSYMPSGVFTNGEDVKYFEYKPLIRPGMNPISQPTQRQPDVSKKIPFIIKAQTDGDEFSRRVMINPVFDGFSENAPSTMKDILIRKRMRSQNGIDLRDVVVNKRRALTKKEVTMPEVNGYSANKEKVVSGQIDGESEYLQKIEHQKLEREKVLREKELRRRQQGWNFNE